jgi:hypothetical protein
MHDAGPTVCQTFASRPPAGAPACQLFLSNTTRLSHAAVESVQASIKGGKSGGGGSSGLNPKATRCLVAGASVHPPPASAPPPAAPGPLCLRAAAHARLDRRQCLHMDKGPFGSRRRDTCQECTLCADEAGLAPTHDDGRVEPRAEWYGMPIHEPSGTFCLAIPMHTVVTPLRSGESPPASMGVPSSCRCLFAGQGAPR